MAKSFKERLQEQTEKLDKTRRLKDSLARVEEQIKRSSEIATVNRALKGSQPPK